MPGLSPTPWVRRCVLSVGQQRRGLRVRPRARPAPVKEDGPDDAETITLTDGTTIRVQTGRPYEEPPDSPPDTTLPLPPPKPARHATLVPSTPSPPLGLTSHPKSRTRTPPSTPPTNPHDYNWYFDTAPPSAAAKYHANSFFERHGPQATLLRSIAHFRTLPATSVPEVAFIGRSNVGKSSLLNAVMGCSTKDLLARTSRTPGFTKTMNLYGIAPEPGVRIKSTAARETITGPRGLVIVDMPGYGAGSLAQWGAEIMKYIQSRKALRRVFVLLDAEHGVKDKDRSILASLRAAGVSHQVVLSKVDKLYVPPGEARRVGRPGKVKRGGSVGKVRACMEGLMGDIRPPVGGGALGEVLACSSEVLVDGRRLGIEDVRYAVLKAVGLEGEERKGFTESKKKKGGAEKRA
ncbi:P-loop containing nucleoside triphosphate hydrolase protein [Boeremia exigua]|uniref:P-loop containing nucleoside triphosphate hydrolase protein n=1 Tax=Boeremia exigua TaxID=749465 RepID=UPI001E8DA219|nr:P-loop containing nucleoside triphosphate hydrolase protein [Boeremia exigua]KAH6633416.1 P-loop containing nucleoside triphosphate hydrolase protein [Boeremia exigua]